MTTSAKSQLFPTAALQVALATSVAEATFADTAYYLYSQRGRNWKIGKPRVVYASSRVMRAAGPQFCNHFNDDSMAGQDIDAETEDYDYQSDSDIGDSEVEECAQRCTLSNKEPRSTMRSPVLDRESAESPGPSKLELAGSQYKYRVVIPDVAATTWQALVHFIYSGEIYFAPLKSQGLTLRAAEQIKHREKHPHLPPLCSPKSIYRLADFVGIEELKFLAREDLKTKITSENVAREIFSRFSSMYDEVLDTELEILYSDSMLADTLPKVLKITTSISRGNMPYGEKALAVLLTKLSTFLVQPLKPPLPPVFCRPRGLDHETDSESDREIIVRVLSPIEDLPKPSNSDIPISSAGEPSSPSGAATMTAVSKKSTATKKKCTATKTKCTATKMNKKAQPKLIK